MRTYEIQVRGLYRPAETFEIVAGDEEQARLGARFEWRHRYRGLDGAVASIRVLGWREDGDADAVV